jgi:hypothetical protein
VRVFTYVMVVDDGGAPNFDRPFVTLALCKPSVRKHAAIGDLILAFTGRALGNEPHAIRWAGIVSEKLEFESYWRDRRFEGKKPQSKSAMPDNIYRPSINGLQLEPNKKHTESHVRTDLSGKYVLVFKESWQFGPTSPILPLNFGLRMIHGRRGHRVHELDESTFKELKRWLDKNRPHRIDRTTLPSNEKEATEANRKIKC